MSNILIKKFRFINDGLAGDVYYPVDGLRSKSAGLFLYGFPAFVGPNEVTSLFVTAGMLAFQPHYFGTYDSTGKYSPTSIIDTCKVSQKLFDRGSVTKATDKTGFPLKTKLEVCVGHSFGTFVAIRSITHLKDVKLLVLLAPTIHYGRKNPDFGVNEDGMEGLEDVRKTNPFTYRLSGSWSWRSCLTGEDPVPNNPDHPSLEEVAIVVGEKDKYFDLPTFEKNIPTLIRGYCGKKVKISFYRLPGVAHPINSGMLDKQNGFDMMALLGKYGMAK